MNSRSLPPEQRSNKKGGKLIPAFCNVLGILILLCVIIACLPLTIPRFMGYEIYNIVSGSMEPEIPVGSIIYVKEIEPETVVVGDIIAFQSGHSVIAHRVVDNQLVEGKFATKGDANATEDMNTVDYTALIGRVDYHFPILGQLMDIFRTGIGKAYVICFAACGAMLNILAGRLRER